VIAVEQSLLDEALTEVEHNVSTILMLKSGDSTVNVNDNNKNTLGGCQSVVRTSVESISDKKGKGQVSDTQKKQLLAIGEDRLVKAIDRYSLELQKDADWRKGYTFHRRSNNALASAKVFLLLSLTFTVTLTLSVTGDELPEMDGMTNMAFSFIKSRIDRDTAAYLEKIEKRREDRKTWWQNQKQKIFQQKQEERQKKQMVFLKSKITLLLIMLMLL